MEEAWIHRRGSARSGFRYVRQDGRPVRDARTLRRIDDLRVPPAWHDVHLASDARRSIQAWGFDARGRKQYRYHARAVDARELRKYHRVRQLARALPRIRRDLRARSRARTLSRDAVCAMALRFISEGLFRPGSERYERENGSYGMTTLRKSHVQVRQDRAVFRYPGKSGKRQRQIVVNSELLALLGRLLRTPGSRLFRFPEDSAWCNLSARSLTAFLREEIGPFAVKDFRTWGGTLRAAVVLAEIGPGANPTETRRNVALAMRIVSSELGNTPAICRASYVHPMVLARYVDDGETIRLPRARSRAGRGHGRGHTPEERALIAFLDRHFPERRRRARPRRTERRASVPT